MSRFPLTAFEKIRLACDWAANRCAFNASTVIANWTIVPDSTCRTVQTNGPKLIYNPKFIDSLSLATARCVILHEAAHVLFEHQFRGETLDPALFNLAADLAINSQLLPEYQVAYGSPNASAKIVALGCFPGHGTYSRLPAGKSVEWYYAELLKEKQNHSGPRPGNTGTSDVPDGDEEEDPDIFTDGPWAASGGGDTFV